MPNQFISPIAGDLETYFINDYAVIDEFAATGSLWLWGNNPNGGLGDNTVVAKSSPVQTVAPSGTNWKLVSCAAYHTPTIKTDGTLWTWGHNGFGNLGNNVDVTNRSSPVQIVGGGTNWKSTASGTYHTTAIKTDGTLWTWGRNSEQQLGRSDVTPRSSPVQTISGGTNWKLVSSGAYHNATIKTDGTLWTWGLNTNGQLGDNTAASKSSPVQVVGGGTNWRLVAGGGYHTLAIKTDGTLWTWGRNGNGQLGDNSITHRSSPIQTVSGGTNWKSVAGGRLHTVAIKTDGTLWTWGHNANSQLGDGSSIVHRSSPIQTVSGGTNWRQVSGGNLHTAAIKTDGTLWLWGQGNVGQLGDNTANSRNSPIQTVAGGTNWKQVSCGFNHTAAIYFYDADNLYPK